MAAIKIFGAVILFVWVQIILSATVQPSREPIEKESLVFNYDPTTHMMGMGVSGHGVRECYVISLNSQEQVLVHSPTGLLTLEQKLVKFMTSDTKTMVSLDQLNATSPKLAHKCNHATQIYILSPI